MAAAATTQGGCESTAGELRCSNSRAPHRAWRARTCCRHGSRPKPPSLGGPVSSADDTPGCARLREAGARPLSTSLTPMRSRRPTTPSGQPLNSAWYSTRLTP